MKILIDFLRKHRRIYAPLRNIYGATIGLWKIKKLFLQKIGIYNSKKRVKLVSEIEADIIIAEKIKSNEPFMLSRFGTGEFRSMFSDKDFNLLYFYSGFFPNNVNLIKDFRKVYFESSKQIDFLAVSLYKNQFMRKIKYIGKLPNIDCFLPLSSLRGINQSWIKELKNKKVLIIHPFKKSIEHQYKIADKLKTMPQLESLEVIKAVQTLANNEDSRFKNWFEALRYMKAEIDKKDFDVAIIGCGAYGLPLAAHIKSLGKQALHLGGGVQILFGIKGKAFDNLKWLKYDKNWIRPLKEDIITDYKKIEGGCYW